MYDEIGAFGHASRAGITAAEVEMLAGDTAAAEEKLIDTYQLREQRGLHETSQWLDLFMARVRCEQSRYQDALPLVEAGWEVDDQDILVAAAVRGRVLARLGKMAEAESNVRDALTRTAKTDDIIDTGEALMALGEVLKLAGRSEEAAAAFEQALHLWEQKGHAVMSTKTRAALAAVVADG
jgi:tetratricopeptide (TPR) repeat protein